MTASLSLSLPFPSPIYPCLRFQREPNVSSPSVSAFLCTALLPPLLSSSNPVFPPRVLSPFFPRHFSTLSLPFRPRSSAFYFSAPCSLFLFSFPPPPPFLIIIFMRHAFPRAALGRFQAGKQADAGQRTRHFRQGTRGRR